jgi:hypothetical protein
MAASHLQSLSHPRTSQGDDFHPRFPQQQPFMVSPGKPGGGNARFSNVREIVQKIAEDCAQRNALQSGPTAFFIRAFAEDSDETPPLAPNPAAL